MRHSPQTVQPQIPPDCLVDALRVVGIGMKTVINRDERWRRCNFQKVPLSVYMSDGVAAVEDTQEPLQGGAEIQMKAEIENGCGPGHGARNKAGWNCQMQSENYSCAVEFIMKATILEGCGRFDSD